MLFLSGQKGRLEEEIIDRRSGAKTLTFLHAKKHMDMENALQYVQGPWLSHVEPGKQLLTTHLIDASMKRVSPQLCHL